MKRASCTFAILFALTAAVVADDQLAPSAEPAVVESTEPQSAAEAQRQAILLHRTYLATLLAVHREYFHEDDRSRLPARVFEDVFQEIDQQTGGTTRWISVNTPPMNVDHLPRPGFEQQAAEALTNGQAAFEQFENSVFRRAAPVPFSAACSKCHQSALGQRRSGRMAALVISLPVQQPQSSVSPLSSPTP
ncbi:MAG: DUF3365 domain-containing protein [Planctomycetaceae bacterium]